MAPYFLHIYLWHVVNYDKSLEGELYQLPLPAVQAIFTLTNERMRRLLNLWYFSFSFTEYYFSPSLSCWLWEYYEYLKKEKSFPIPYYVSVCMLQNNFCFTYLNGKRTVYVQFLLIGLSRWCTLIVSNWIVYL
jgi:hypothetical protein